MPSTFVIEERAAQTPRDESGSPAQRGGLRRLLVGLAIHLGPPVGMLAWLAASGLELVHVLASGFVMGFAGYALTEYVARPDPLEPLPSLSFRKGVGILAVHIVGKGFAVGLTLLMTIWGLGALVLPSHLVHSGVGAIVLVLLAGDFAYYAIHRWLFHSTTGGVLRRFKSWARRTHWVHHAVEHLDFLRGNIGSFFDNGVISFPVPTGLIALAVGLDLPSTVLVYMLLMMMQVTHHANAEFDLGPLRYVFVSDVGHKMHHCTRGHLVNFGGIFAFWDVAFGSFYDDPAVRPSALHHARRPLPIRRRTAGRKPVAPTERLAHAAPIVRFAVRYLSVPGILVATCATYGWALGADFGPVPPAVAAFGLASLVMALCLVTIEARYPLEGFRATRRQTVTDVAFNVGTALLLLCFHPVIGHVPLVWDGGAAWHPAVQFVVGWAAHDLVLYGWHRLVHTSGSTRLWRLHAIHHEPRRMTFMAGGRSHLVEIGVTVVALCMARSLFGLSEAVMLWVFMCPVVSGAIHHTDVDFRMGWLNFVFPGPEMHRAHHDRDPASALNYATSFPLWDVVFGTARPLRHAGQTRFGLEDGDDLDTTWWSAHRSPFERG